jgi:hypothetical protein
MWKMNGFKGKFSGMSHEGFFLSIPQKEYSIWGFFLDVNFENTSNAKLHDVFYR